MLKKFELDKLKLNIKKLFTIKRCIIVFIFMIISYIVYTTTSIIMYADNDEKCKADVVIILGAGTADDKVSPVFEERLNHGITLYNDGYVDKLIITGGFGDGQAMSDAYIGKKYVMEKGIPDENILIEEESTITQENLINAKVIMDKEEYKKAIIVSDPLHMKRSMIMADDIGIEAYSSPTPTTKYVTYKSKVPFLCREEFFYVGYRIYRILGR